MTKRNLTLVITIMLLVSIVFPATATTMEPGSNSVSPGRVRLFSPEEYLADNARRSAFVLFAMQAVDNEFPDEHVFTNWDSGKGCMVYGEDSSISCIWQTNSGDSYMLLHSGIWVTVWKIKNVPMSSFEETIPQEYSQVYHVTASEVYEMARALGDQ